MGPESNLRDAYHMIRVFASRTDRSSLDR